MSRVRDATIREPQIRHYWDQRILERRLRHVGFPRAEDVLMALADLPPDFWTTAVDPWLYPPGSGCWEAAPMLYALARFCQPRRFLEIGTANGSSLEAVLEGFIREGSGEAHTVDLFDFDPEQFCGQHRLAPPGPVQYYRHGSEALAPTWPLDLGLLFVDGHKPLTAHDLSAFLPFVREGGWAVVHDYGDPTVRQAIDAAAAGWRRWTFGVALAEEDSDTDATFCVLGRG